MISKENGATTFGLKRAREATYRQIVEWLGEEGEGPHSLDVAPTVETVKE